jgi:hypothetical protein
MKQDWWVSRRIALINRQEGSNETRRYSRMDHDYFIIDDLWLQWHLRRFMQESGLLYKQMQCNDVSSKFSVRLKQFMHAECMERMAGMFKRMPVRDRDGQRRKCENQ